MPWLSHAFTHCKNSCSSNTRFLPIPIWAWDDSSSDAPEGMHPDALIGWDQQLFDMNATWEQYEYMRLTKPNVPVVYGVL